MIKSFKVANVQMKKDGSGVTMALGSKSKNAKYATSIEVIVRDSDGNELARQTDGYLVIKDPRKNPNLTEEQISKIPDWIRSEVSLVTDKE